MACLNRAHATSDRISAAQLDRARRAADHAHAIGRDFTHQLVVHWTHADGSGKVQDRYARLQVCARHWLERRGEPLVSLWSVEPDRIGTGWHTHTLLHLPRGLVRDFANMLPRWTSTEPLEIATARWDGKKPPKGSVACGGYAESPWSPVWLLQRRYDDSERLLEYVLKASQRHNRGRVIGKRVGYSHAISPSAWKQLPSVNQQAAERG